MKKLAEKFEYHADKGLIFSDIHRLVYDSQIVGEFEEGGNLCYKPTTFMTMTGCPDYMSTEVVGSLLFENYFLGKNVNNPSR